MMIKLHTSPWYFRVPLVAVTLFSLGAVLLGNRWAWVVALSAWITLIIVGRARHWSIIYDQVYFGVWRTPYKLTATSDARAWYYYWNDTPISATLFLINNGHVQYVIQHVYPDDCRQAVCLIKSTASRKRCAEALIQQEGTSL